MQSLPKNGNTYFNSIATQFIQGNSIFLEYFRELKRAIKPYIKGNVLDIGCGGMVIVNPKQAESVILTDIAKDTLTQLFTPTDYRIQMYTKPTNVKTQVCSGLDLPFKKESFDVVYMSNVAHHVSTNNVLESRKNIIRLFTEAKRVLKKNGIFLFDDSLLSGGAKLIQNHLFPLSFWIFSLFGIPQPYFLSIDEVYELLQSTQFVIKDQKNIPWSKQVTFPFFPSILIPGNLWSKIQKNYLFIVKKLTN